MPLKNTPAGPDALCRNILVQVDGKKSLEDITTMFRGLKGLDEAIQKLFAGSSSRSPVNARTWSNRWPSRCSGQNQRP